ncbi:MAG TPA: TIGR03862 family flavoprotein [Anaerolineales bacterium]|nr:TIGR03862 family flavoprotein [Anaerolineales bacterium]
MKVTVAVIGGGPAGLMAAEVISAHGLQVEVYDAMPSLGRKFLMAGKSGLNITYAEPFEQFVSRYGERRPQIERLLKTFGPDELIGWVHGLGIETFVGTSRRIFPVGMKASPLLRAWLNRLRDWGVIFHPRHKWTGFITLGPAAVPGDDRAWIDLKFDSPDSDKTVHANAAILALGGGSWSRLGSDGAWVPWLRQAGVQVAPLRPSNCGFDVTWSPHFRERFDGHPVKSVVLSFGGFHQQGEFIITKEGVEGGLIYTASALLRDEIEAKGSAVTMLDLLSDRSYEWLVERLSQTRGSRSMATHLEKTVNITGVKAGLLREFAPKEDFAHPGSLAHFIKNLPIPLIAARPLDEAISSAGGVKFESLDERLMLKSMPGVFCAGEMLDWEAPTGGYLLTACFASGHTAGEGVVHWLSQ